MVNSENDKMKLWNKLAQDARVIAILIGTNVAQFIIILSLIVCVLTIPTRFTFHIPPDLNNGATLQANKIPNAYVGQFAFNIWQVINNWSKNGALDANRNLALYGAYLTPEFKYQLEQHYKKLKAQGELQGRVRVIRPIYNEKPQVKKLNANTWQVILKARDSEYVNGVLIKDKEIEYPFKIIRFDGNEQLNPFGLAIAGFNSNPFVIKTFK